MLVRINAVKEMKGGRGRPPRKRPGLTGKKVITNVSPSVKGRSQSKQTSSRPKPGPKAKHVETDMTQSPGQSPRSPTPPPHSTPTITPRRKAKIKASLAMHRLTPLIEDKFQDIGS